MIANLVIIMALLLPCIAEPDSVTTGPYKVNFDLGLPKGAYTIEISDPKATETLAGNGNTRYHIEFTNKTGITRGGYISLTTYEDELIIPTSDELVRALRLAFSKALIDVQAAGRKIDGHNGAVVSGTSIISGVKVDTYVARYYLSSTTIVDLMSSYPWDEGTLSLLKTIHIEKTG